MEPEDQSRHSKTKPEPVTIDLGAEEVTDMAAGDPEGTEDNVTADADTAPATEAETSAKSYSGIPNANSSAAAQPQPTTAKGSGSLSLIAASLIGGVIALGGAAGLQYWGVLPSLGSNEETKVALNLMSSEVEKLKTEVAAQPEVDLSPVNAKITALEEKMTTVPEANGLSADADARINALAEQVKAAEAAVGTQKTESETARAALEMRIEAIEKTLSQPRDDVEVAVAIASAGLKAAIDRGGPFISELDTLEGVDPEDPAVKELKQFAAIGVPSRTSLVTDFPAVADTILSAVVIDDPNQSLTDRLMSSAFSAIKVRPVGDVEGEGPDAVVARMEEKLKNGDFTGAASEWAKLPEPAKAASAAYKKQLDARIRVEELVGNALTKAVSTTKTNG
ncbi:COG4223 family protein [Rhizobium sp. TH2]|uniref:COG4223 family protein n=1 Tax=Rhizobium sp. TH2 TaxID=2775403 RepID=UPI00215754CE|nr:mitofilin family membrane protein [Rhizobium sp. TH2]UVC08376.1 COG4223 family protein [Rhizobium sp. TH2]